MSIPENLKYTKDHEWVLVEGDTATIGITEFAQSELGDIVYVEVDTVGEDLDAEATFGTVEAVKTVSDLFMPISGNVKEMNESLEETPESVNTDPYGEGWMIKVTIADPSQLDDLLSPEQYAELIGQDANCWIYPLISFNLDLTRIMLLKFFWFPVLWTLLIIGAHAIPGHELPKPFWDFFQFDKIAHFMMFSILTFTWLNGIMKQSTIYKLKVHGPKIVLAFSLILGLVLETLQNAIFVNRSFQWADVIADGAGGVVGIMIFYAIYGQVLKYTL